MSLEMIIEEMGQTILDFLGGIAVAAMFVWLLNLVTAF
jgi:hypothetical protein